MDQRALRADLLRPRPTRSQLTEQDRSPAVTTRLQDPSTSPRGLPQTPRAVCFFTGNYNIFILNQNKFLLI